MLSEYDIPFQETFIHCWRGGSGPGVVVLHGSGAGAGTMGNFGAVLEPLAEHFEVLEVLGGYVGNMQDLVIMQKRFG